MLNPAHIVETALLMLVAFLIGATAGFLARRLVSPRGRTRAEAERAFAAPAATSAEPPLVVAPTIAPLARTTPRRTPAERLAAAAGRDPEPVAAAVVAATAGTAASTPATAAADADAPAPPAADAPPPPADAEAAAAEVGAPQAAEPDVTPSAPESPPGSPDEAELLPPLVPELAAIEPLMPEPEHADQHSAALDPVEPAASEARAEPEAAVEPEPAPQAMPSPAFEPTGPGPRESIEAATGAGEEDDDPEAAARRAIEGSWSPRRSAGPPSRPVQHPELAEVEAAVASVRTAVASAAAAAAAVVGERSGLDFEATPEIAPEPFLDTGGEVAPHIETSGLSFGGAAHKGGFGRPEALPGPRHGQADNLKLIKGITPQLESSLNALGIFHFDQIAGWDQKAVVWMDTHLSLKGRIAREKWQEQARDLGRGKARPARPVRR